MTLRLGGYAAIVGGPLWLLGLAGASADQTDTAGPWIVLMSCGTAALLVALIGLSSFQARRYPRLTWAAFALPAAGTGVSAVGAIAMAAIGDRPFVGDLSPWYVWMFGTIAMFAGSGLFAIVTWRTRTLSRRGAGILAITPVAVFVSIPAMAGVVPFPDVLVTALFFVALAGFVGGWVALGVSAVRSTGAAPITLEGAAS